MITGFDVTDGEAFYVAIHVAPGRETNLLKNLATIPPLAHHLNQFRLMVLTFSNTVESIGIFDETNVYDVLRLNSKPKSSGIQFDNVAGIVMADHSPFRSTGHPKLFVYCDETLHTAWNPPTLAQMIDVTWIGVAGLSIGKTETVNHEMVALRAIFGALEPFADVKLWDFMKDDKVAALLGTSMLTFRQFREADRVMKIARILTDKPA
jgi:hypothetical protein